MAFLTGGNHGFWSSSRPRCTLVSKIFARTGNLTADPHGAYTYNGAQQMSTVTKGGTVYYYSYAGASQNEVLSETTPKGYYELTYGRTDAQGQPIIEQLSKDSNTACIEHDPVTGEPLMLRTSAGMESLYIADGTGNPTALIAAGNYVSVAYAYDPYGVQTITKDAGGNATDQTPYTFKCGLQDRTTGWVHNAPAGTTPPPAAGPNQTPKTTRSTPTKPTATPTPSTTPSTTQTHWAEMYSEGTIS